MQLRRRPIRPRRPWRAAPIALTAAMLAFSTLPASAQELHVDAMRTWPDHPLLGAPHGIGLSLEQEMLDGVGVRIGVSVHGDRFQGFGTTCVGLVPAITDCAGEPTSERSHLGVLTVSAPISVVHHARLRLRVLPAVLMSRIESEQVGMTSGRRRGAERFVFGYDIGTELTFAPLSGRPLQLVMSGHQARLHPWRTWIIADGHTPFDQDIRMHRIQLGLSILR